MRILLVLGMLLLAADATAFEVTMTAAVNDGVPLVASGTTNLPDGTELLATITDMDGGVYLAEGKIIVKGGTFRSGPFPQPLNPDCSLNIISQIALYQPARVRAVIGDFGDLMTGNHVVKGSVGGLIVSYHAKITLGRKALAGRVAPAATPKVATPKKTVLTFNRYSSYRALQAAGRKDLPPLSATR
ncbi:MAG TPA: hypothetical protein VF799_06770 [Geobacteraceae bacterium]